jgi:hypothetical protein
LRVKNTSLRRRARSLIGLTIALASLSLLTGCAAGPNAATRLITQVTDGVEGEAGPVKLRNFTLVLQPDSSVVLVGTIVNQDEVEDAVLAIGINGERAKVWADGGEVEALPLILNRPQHLAGPSATAYAYLDSFTVKAGYRVPVEVILQRGGIVNLDVLVRERDLEFADVSLPN